MRVVVLDTNALMMPVELGVRVFDELERLVGRADLVVPGGVVGELERLARGSGPEADAARVGLDLAGEHCRVVETTAGAGDPAVLEAVREHGAAYVVTNDRALRDRVLEAGVPVIGVRGANTLGITEP